MILIFHFKLLFPSMRPFSCKLLLTYNTHFLTLGCSDKRIFVLFFDFLCLISVFVYFFQHRFFNISFFAWWKSITLKRFAPMFVDFPLLFSFCKINNERIASSRRFVSNLQISYSLVNINFGLRYSRFRCKIYVLIENVEFSDYYLVQLYL